MSVGCGVNVLNAPPIPSLAQLLPEGAPAPTMERTLAAVMARFERIWTQFVAARGSFESFMDLYLERWLHSYAVVFSFACTRVSDSCLRCQLRAQGPARDADHSQPAAPGPHRGHHIRAWVAAYDGGTRARRDVVRGAGVLRPPA